MRYLRPLTLLTLPLMSLLPVSIGPPLGSLTLPPYFLEGGGYLSLLPACLQLSPLVSVGPLGPPWGPRPIPPSC